MFRLSFLALVFFSFSNVYADVPTQAEIDASNYRSSDAYKDGSGSLLKATQSGDSEQVCIAAGGDNCGGSSGNSGSGSASGGGSPQGAATQQEIQKAIEGYVIPTSTRNFSLSNLNVSNEMNLEISNSNNQNNVIFRVMRLIAMLVGTVAILLYIVGGYFMIVSQGDDNALSKGKQIITFTSLGLVIVFGAYMLIQFVMGLIYFNS